MTVILKGADTASAIRNNLTEAIHAYHLTPCLAVVRVGCKDSDLAYEKGLASTCAKTGIELKVFELPETIEETAFEDAFQKINQDPAIHGILLFRPLPSHLDEKRITQLIDPSKDVDCMNPVNLAKLFMGDTDGFAPCTAEAVIRILDHEGVSLNGAKAVVIGRSLVIGKPLSILLLSRNATVTCCHSRTRDLAGECRGADILISACGAANLVDESIAKGLNASCTAIDVGVNFVDGKMCGDFDFDAVSHYAGKVTPVPGGVGAVTNTVLAAHVVLAACRMAGYPDVKL